ncbi:hypothetical protein KR067_000203 [Drosophila pandora]|nr:hypothetical protein KR067_000203 [Drosophila pandora]
MRCTPVIVFLSALALNSCPARANFSSEKSLDDGVIVWPMDLIHFPQAYTLMHKVEKRMECISDEEARSRIMDYTVDELRKCKLDFQMCELCVRRSIPYTMSFISSQQRQQRQ